MEQPNDISTVQDGIQLLLGSFIPASGQPLGELSTVGAAFFQHFMDGADLSKYDRSKGRFAQAVVIRSDDCFVLRPVCSTAPATNSYH